MTCRDVAEHLPGVAAGEVVLPVVGREHVEQCLRCQAEVVQHRRILRSMRSLREELLEPTPGLVPDLLAGLHDAGERRAVWSLLHGRRPACAIALVGVGAAGAAGVLVALRSRRRRAPA